MPSPLQIHHPLHSLAAPSQRIFHDDVDETSPSPHDSACSRLSARPLKRIVISDPEISRQRKMHTGVISLVAVFLALMESIVLLCLVNLGLRDVPLVSSFVNIRGSNVRRHDEYK
jgi:hypothetical protein